MAAKHLQNYKVHCHGNFMIRSMLGQNPGITAKLVSLIQSSSTLDEAVEKIKKASNESINNDTEIAGELIKALADKYKMEFNLAAQQVLRADLSQEDQKDLAKEISWGDEDYLVFVVSRLKNSWRSTVA